MSSQPSKPEARLSHTEALIPVAFLCGLLVFFMTATWILPGNALAGSSNGKGQQSSTSSSSSSSSSGNGNGNGNGSSSGGSTTSTSSSSSSSSSSGGSTSSSSSSGGSTSSSSSSSSSGAVQASQTTFDPNNTLNVDFDGNPSQISGNDHDLNGNKIADQSNSKPAIGVAAVSSQWVDGSGSSTAMSGVMISGTHNDAQVEGGVTNNLNPDRWKSLEAFIQNARNSADITLDTSTNQNITSKLNNDQWSVVYAKPSNPSQEGKLHFAGSGGGRGVLILEVNDPSKGQLLMNANATWVGLVIVVVNYRDTANNNNGNGTPVDLRGSGNNGGGHVLGGGIIFNRNQANTNGAKGDVFGEMYANFSGGGSLTYSTEALTNAKVKVTSSMQVVSWRKLPVP